MTDQHPITPPSELVKQWRDDWFKAKIKHASMDQYVATQAARWGADLELDACCEWTESFADWGDLLRLERRPKPLTQKEQALAAFDSVSYQLDEERQEFIRRALKELPDD